MRYSDLAGKEIIAVDEGIRLGVVDHTDLVINTRTGEVDSIIIPYGRRLWGSKVVVIPWRGITKIGRDFIIVDLSTATDYGDTLRRIEAGQRRNKPLFSG
ncbi:MAG TPA: YlmC/YmxH family sporulation protein [Firmicutes bacterium]|jgi:YlmC/YmxH family sporulation protein|nr:YlmC/YmxH family sporulation protein [Bacillota bacterium]